MINFGINRMLTAVVAVDSDIFLGQIARETPVPPAAESERDFERDLRLLHCARDCGLIVVGIALSFMRDTDAAKPDREPVTIGRFAGLADSHHDSAPVGVLAGDRSLDERRIRDGESNLSG